MNCSPLYTPELLEQHEDLVRYAHPGIDVMYPRRLIDVPQNYFHPKYFASYYIGTSTYLFHMNAKTGKPFNDIDEVKAVGYFAGCKLAPLRVPTYFIKPDLAHALLHTTPPAAFKLAELHWPYDAMMFIPPLEFSMAYLGDPIQFIQIVRFHKDEVLKCPVPLTLRMQSDYVAADYMEPVRAEKDCFIVYASIVEKVPNGIGISCYHFVCPIKPETDISEVLRHASSDIMVYYGDRNPFLRPGDGAFDPKRDSEVSGRLTDLALRLILFMQAVPNAVTKGECVRKPRIERGAERETPGLYKPWYIGEHFVLKRLTPRGVTTGTHASPHMHWRIGHWTHQPIGPRAAGARKLLWREPVLVNKDLAAPFNTLSYDPPSYNPPNSNA